MPFLGLATPNYFQYFFFSIVFAWAFMPLYSCSVGLLTFFGFLCTYPEILFMMFIEGKKSRFSVLLAALVARMMVGGRSYRGWPNIFCLPVSKLPEECNITQSKNVYISVPLNGL